jgi:hypothetical protein
MVGVGLFKVLRMREAIIRRETRPVVLEQPEFATIHFDPTSISYTRLQPLSQHRPALSPIPWRYVGAIPDPPPNTVACGDLTSAHGEAKLSKTATVHGEGGKHAIRLRNSVARACMLTGSHATYAPICNHIANVAAQYCYCPARKLRWHLRTQP